MALPLGVFVAGYPKERISSGSGAAFAAGLATRSVPLMPIMECVVGCRGYPRECNSSGSGAPLARSSPSMSTRLERKRVRGFP